MSGEIQTKEPWFEAALFLDLMIDFKVMAL